MTAALRTDRKGFLGIADDQPLDQEILARFETLLTRLRDAVRSQPAGESDVELYVDSRDHAVKVKAFAAMSGNDVEVRRKDSGFSIRVTGGSCNACR